MAEIAVNSPDDGVVVDGSAKFDVDDYQQDPFEICDLIEFVDSDSGLDGLAV